MALKRFQPYLQTGFTLIEVMVTVAIVAIISAIAIPIYTGYVTRANVQTGVQGLAVARTRMEQYFMDNRTYANGADCGAVLPTEADADNFGFACEPTATTYTVTATGVAGTNMDGFVYTINEQNVRTSTITKTGWGSGGTVQCWITKQGESC